MLEGFPKRAHVAIRAIGTLSASNSQNECNYRLRDESREGTWQLWDRNVGLNSINSATIGIRKRQVWLYITNPRAHGMFGSVLSTLPSFVPCSESMITKSR